MNSLLLSMPGSPIIYYGDEIGMGDNVFLGDRNGVRTPMQWSPDRNAGFSRADPQRLYLPPIMDPIYGYEAVNVEAQLREPSLAAELDAAHARGAQDQPGLRPRHAARSCSPGNRKVLAYLREHGDDAILCVANLSRSAQPVELDLSRFKGRVPVELLGRTPFPPIGELPYLLTLPALRLLLVPARRRRRDAALARRACCRAEDLPVLVLFDGWTSLFRDRVVPWRIALAEKTRAQFETRDAAALHRGAALVRGQGRAHRARRAAPTRRCGSGRPTRWLLALLELDGPPAPATLLRAAGASPGKTATRSACARLAACGGGQGAPAGRRSACWATRSPTRPSAARWSRRSAPGATLPTARGKLQFRPTAAFERARRRRDVDARCRCSRPPAQSSNTVVTLGERLFLKGYRRLQPGVEPGARDRPLPDRGRAVRALRAGGRRARVRRRRRHAR